MGDITITREKAKELAVITKKRYAQMTVNIYPEILNYHPHCQGAILSIIFNRGPGLAGNRRLEMRQIQDALKENRGHDIPGYIRDSKRLWQSTNRGLLGRRDGEANWFRIGLNCDCY